MPDVRTTYEPGKVINCSPQAFTDLSRQGLILEVVTTPAAVPTIKAAPKPAPGPTATDKSKEN